MKRKQALVALLLILASLYNAGCAVIGAAASAAAGYAIYQATSKN